MVKEKINVEKNSKYANKIFSIDECRLEALLKINEMTSSTRKEISDFTLERAIELTGSKIGYLAFLNEDETILNMYSWSREAMKKCKIENKPREYKVDSTGLWGEAVRQRQAVITNNYQSPNPLKKGVPEGHVNIIRHMNVPIFDEDKIVIVAGVGNKEIEYNETDVHQLTLMMQGMWSILRRQEADRKLRHLSHQNRLVLESVGEGIFGTDYKGIIIYGNPASARILGCTGEELIGKHIHTIFKRYQSENKENFDELPLQITFKEGKAYNGEDNFIKKDSTVFQAEYNLAPLIENEQVIGSVIAFHDITKRKQDEEDLKKSKERLEASLKEKDVLLREVHHRVKNNMQIISSLLNLQSRNIKDETYLELIKESRDRVKSMAIIHEKLYQSDDLAEVYFADYIKSLANYLFSSYTKKCDHIKLSIESDNIYLDIDSAIPCGLIMNEILSNSLKHAFPWIESQNTVSDDLPKKEGQINIKFDKNDDKLILSISDNGVGFPKDFDIKNTDSLGLRLVNILVKQLNGRMELNNKNGSEFKFIF